MLSCASCGTANEAGRKFCIECGQRLDAAPCSVCGTVNPAGAKFCGECGNALAVAPAGIAPVPPRGTDRSAVSGAAGLPGIATSSPVAERRLVSVLFTDLVGFTTISEDRDPEEMREVLSRYFDIARDTVERHGGVIEKFIGDAVMAVWGTPTAHEDDAERAVRAALELVDAVSAIRIGADRLAARGGVLTGEAAVTIGATNQGMVAGDLVNTAARLQSVAAPGTVLVGDATVRAASGAIAFEEVGPQALKGKESPVPAWRAAAVVSLRRGQGRAATLEPPFVGRDEELRTLKDQLHATKREGKPRLVTLVGQAGIGKSRLAWELEKYVDGVVETIYWHEGRSPSYGEGISYWALAEMIRGRAGIAESEEPATSRGRIAEMLSTFVSDPVERRWIEPRLTGLLGLEELPSETREELFAAWRTFFERLAEQSPVILVFWDLQWADQGMLDFIEHLLTSARTSPIFVLAEARPELFERRPGWGLTVRSATSIHLEPLSAEDMRALLFGMVPGLPEHALRAIVERAEGVPLYAVETLRMLIGRGVLQPEADGARFTLVADLPELAVPETLHALIAARLDALAPEERALISDAAVLGLSFTVDALTAVSGGEDEGIRRLLDSLVRHEILVLDVDPRSSERGQYRFIQGVVREVAYQSLAKRDRRTKHLAAARYFEALGEEEIAGVLASHYAAAYRATPAGPEADALAAQARVALRAAADRAAALHSHLGALDYLNQAIRVTEDAGERAMLHERAARAATNGAKTRDGVAHAEQAEKIHADRGDRLGVLRARGLHAWSVLAEHQDRTAIGILEAALADVGDLPPSPEIAFAQAELARALMISGSRDALVWADRVLANPDLMTPDALMNIIITKGTAQLNAGFVMEGTVTLQGAIVVADRMGDQWTALRGRNNLLGAVEPVNLDDAMEVVRESYEIARRLGQGPWLLQVIGTAMSGSFDQGSWDEWMAEGSEVMADGADFYRLWYQSEIARRLAYRGELEQANARLADIRSSETVASSAQATASIDGLIAELRLLQGRFEEAFEIASRSWNHTDAARLSILVALLASAALRDGERLSTATHAIDEFMIGAQPMTSALHQVAGLLAALLEARWSDARHGNLAASRALESAAQPLSLAWVRVVVGSLAGDRFPEAAEGLALADSWFTERGASQLVAAYRSRAGAPRLGATAGRGRDAGQGRQAAVQTEASG